MSLVLDIETIPSLEALAAWTAVEEMAERRKQDPTTYAATCPALARIVSAGFLHLGSDKERCIYDQSLFAQADNRERVVAAADEPALLNEVSEILGKVRGLVTFNGRSFDLPLLIHRLKIHGLDIPALLIDSMKQKPWESFPHVDMALELTFGRATSIYPLRAYAISYGLPDPKGSVDGAKIGDLIEAGDPVPLVDYQLGDVFATAELCRRFSGG